MSKFMKFVTLLFACCRGGEQETSEEETSGRQSRRARSRSPQPGTSRSTPPEDHQIINVLPALDMGWNTPAKMAAKTKDHDKQFVKDEIEFEKCILQHEIIHVLSADSNMSHSMGAGKPCRKRKRNEMRRTKTSLQPINARPGQMQSTSIATTGRHANRPKAAVRRRMQATTSGLPDVDV